MAKSSRVCTYRAAELEGSLLMGHAPSASACQTKGHKNCRLHWGGKCGDCSKDESSSTDEGPERVNVERNEWREQKSAAEPPSLANRPSDGKLELRKISRGKNEMSAKIVPSCAIRGMPGTADPTD